MAFLGSYFYLASSFVAAFGFLCKQDGIAYFRNLNSIFLKHTFT